MKCRQCGADIPDDSQFCENCGLKVERTAPAAPVYQPQPQPQPVQVNPVYPPNSIYAANAYEMSQAQPVLVQPIYDPMQPSMQYQQQYVAGQQAYVSSIPQYQAPVYYQPGMYKPVNKTFNKVLKIVSSISLVLYVLLLLVMLGETVLGENYEPAKILLAFLLAGYSVFVLVFSCVRKSIGKGAFITFLVTIGVSIYMFSSLVSTGS